MLQHNAHILVRGSAFLFSNIALGGVLDVLHIISISVAIASPSWRLVRAVGAALQPG